jgi:HK97 family phage prohead protease
MELPTNIHFLTFGFKASQVKADDADSNFGTVEGYASVFGNVDLGLDVVDKGAFKKTLRENGGKVAILADHNPTAQIGWNEKGEEDDTGLFVLGKLNLKVQKAQERYALAKQAFDIGVPTGLSIGYTTIKAEPDATNQRIRRLKELKLWEYSLVTFPMNTSAMLTAAKSMGALDKATFLIKELVNQGVTLKDFEMALRKEAAHVDHDPVQLNQSLDNLINKFRTT